MDESEATIEYEEEEETALAQLEGEEEVIEEIPEEEIFEPGEIFQTDIEELFPEQPYTVYYQEG